MTAAEALSEALHRAEAARHLRSEREAVLVAMRAIDHVWTDEEIAESAETFTAVLLAERRVTLARARL